tara:strand:- start:4218 stop:5294 length:1077 start_codon:yes stop_codon:yes gene_type:complete
MTKKILFLIPDLEIGGAQRILIFLSNILLKKKFKIKILYLKKKNRNTFKLEPKIKAKCLNLDKETNNFFEKIKHNLIRIRKIREELKDYKPSYVISFLTTVNIITIISSINLKQKIIINERNDLKKEIPFAWKFLRFILYRFSDKVVFNQPDSNKILKKFVSTSKIYFIPNPYILRKKNSKVNREKIILFVGRLTYQKNVNLLIKSFYKSNAIKKGWKLIIIGRGSQLNLLKNKIKRLKIKNNIFFNGTSKQIEKWYEKSSIYIICSRYEGMPNTLIESMYYKLAIIGTKIPGVQYLIKNRKNGLLINSNDEKELTKNINLLLDNKKLRNKLGLNAQKTILKKGNPNLFQNKWLKILK